MIFGSVCSGIEAASVAWEPLGWRAAFLSEIDKFPRAVLAHHYPQVPCHGDFTTIRAGEYEPIDLLVGGTPCQSFSIAGLRGGMADARGNLALEYLRLAGRLRPRWIVWENVPGVLSSTSHNAPDFCPPNIDLDASDGPQDGEEIMVEDRYEADESHAFSCFLAGLSELGYGFAYRVPDAQYARVAQRRRRVFVVGYLGDWRRAAAVLFERESLSWNPAPSREAGEGVAPTISARPTGGGGLGTDFDLDGGLIAKCLSASHTASGRYDPSGETFITHTLKGEGFDASEDGTGRGVPLVPVAFNARQDPISGNVAQPIGAKDNGNGVLFSIMPQNSGKDFKARPVDVAQPLMAGGPVGGNQGGDFIVRSGVRRLTPRECERLQSFPDDYTLIPWRKGLAPDGPRYRALGNSMCVNLVRMIGERIAAVDAL